TYYITATNACGQAADSATIKVNYPPALSASNDTSICEGNAVILSAAGVGDIAWSTGDNSPAITVNPLADASYMVSATTACGTLTDTIEIAVTQLPTVSISGADSICENDPPLILQATISNTN